MKSLKNYHRPQTMAEALELLEAEGAAAAVLAGGTSLVASGDDVEMVIDIQDLGLDHVRQANGEITAGAALRLQDLADFEGTPALIREGVYNEGPNTFRNAGTLGGLVASGDWESELLAALLVCEAVIRQESLEGPQEFSLQDYLAAKPGPGLIAEIDFQTTGEMATARVARTPMDRAIVAAAGRRTPEGRLLVAMSGVGKTPMLVDPAGLDGLDYPEDFRGSAEYRGQMAKVLAGRVLKDLQ